MRQNAIIISQQHIAPDTYRMRLSAPEMVARMQPGQFVHVRVQSDSTSFDPLLRRPISLADYNVEQGTFDLVYQVVGRGTEILSDWVPNEKLDVLGPIGRAFPLPNTSYQTVALVAGGLGVPPLLPLARELLRTKAKVVLFLGARSAKQLLMVDDFAALGVETRLYTDDGSAGHCGRVTDGLLEELRSMQVDRLYACGPMPMLRALHPLVKQASVEAWFSLETHMACGIGACLGCTVTVHEGDTARLALLCQEGPVFAAQEVSFDVTA